MEKNENNYNTLQLQYSKSSSHKKTENFEKKIKAYLAD